MQKLGRVQNGVIVLENGSTLPEGATVIVSCDPAPTASGKTRVEFPLVRSSRPGTVPLTNERIAEIEAEDDESARR